MSGDFHYSLEKNDIINYMKLSTEEKLQWLEDIIQFTEEVMTDEARKVRAYFQDNEGCEQ